MANPKYDWQQIKKEYVEGIATEHGVTYPTLEELANKYGCNQSYIRRRAGAEGWTDLRNIYQAKIEQKARERRTEKLALQQANFDFDVFKVTKNLLAYVKGRINKLNKEIQESGNQKLPSLNEMDQLVKILRQVQEVGKRSLGEESESSEEIIVRVPGVIDG